MSTLKLNKQVYRAFHYRLAMLLLVAAHLAVSYVSAFGFLSVANGIMELGAFVIMALGACFILLLESNDRHQSATRLDLPILIVTALQLYLTAALGRKFDIGLTLSMLTVYFWLTRNTGENNRYIAVILAALAINTLWAPLLFQLYKSQILLAESTFVGVVAAFMDYPITTEGAFIKHETGLRLTMVGACSIYNNLTAALLGYATVQGLFRKMPVISDTWFVIVLFVIFMIGNAFRLIAMTPSYSHYLYWHDGAGTYFVQGFLLVVVVVLCFAFLRPGKPT